MTLADIQLVRSLYDKGIEDTAQLGGKAATLAELKRAGFPVPVRRGARRFSRRRRSTQAGDPAPG